MSENTVKQDTFEKKRNNSTNLIEALQNNKKKTQILHFIYKNMALLFFLYDGAGADNKKDVYMIKKKEFINNDKNADIIEYDEKDVITDEKNTKKETTNLNKIKVKEQTNEWFNSIKTQILTTQNNKMSIIIYLDFLNMCREICDDSIKNYKTIFHKLYKKYLEISNESIDTNDLKQNAEKNKKITEIVEQISCFFEGILILNRYTQNPFYLNHFKLFETETKKYFYETNLTSNQLNKRFIEDKDKKIMKSVLSKQYDNINDKNLFNNINSYILYFFVKDESSGKSIALILYEIMNNETKNSEKSKLWTVVNDFMCKNKNAIVLLSVDPVNICKNESISETETGTKITRETTYHTLLFPTATATITTTSTPTLDKIKEEEDNLVSVLGGNYEPANRQNETDDSDDSSAIESLINDDFTDFTKIIKNMYIRYEKQFTVKQFLYALALEKPYWFINYLLACILQYKKNECDTYKDDFDNNIHHYIVSSSLKQEEKMDLIDEISNGSNNSNDSIISSLQDQIAQLNSKQGQIVKNSLKGGEGGEIRLVPSIFKIIEAATAAANLPPPPSNESSNASNESSNASNESSNASNESSNASNENSNQSNENLPPTPPSIKEELEKEENEKLKKELEKKIKEKLEKEKIKDSDFEMQKWKSDSSESDSSESDKSSSSDEDELGGGSRRETIGLSWSHKQSGGGSYDKMFEANRDGTTPFMILMENGIDTEKESNFIIKIIEESDIQLDQENVFGHNMYDILNDNIISLINENYDIKSENKEIKQLVDSFAELCENTEE